MPRDTLLLDVPGLAIAEVRCRGESTGWSPEEPIERFAMVLVQRGRFQRRVDGFDRFVDAAVGYVQWPGSVQQIAHPQGGDVCTVLVPAGSMLGDLIDRVGLQETVFTSPGFDLAHRMVVTLARQGADRFEITERASLLMGEVLVAFGSQGLDRAVTVSFRARSLADDVRQAIDRDPGLHLDELADLTGRSVFHLSRTFRRVTGLTISRYRRRIRLRRAIDRLSAGDRDLARLAADLGFADQAHLTRSLRTEIEITPGRLRGMFTPERTS